MSRTELSPLPLAAEAHDAQRVWRTVISCHHEGANLHLLL